MSTGWRFNRNGVGSVAGATLMLSGSVVSIPELMIVGGWLTAIFCTDQICLTMKSIAKVHFDDVGRLRQMSADASREAKAFVERKRSLA